MIYKWYRKSQVDKHRSEFKQAVIKSAIEKSLPEYQPAEDSKVTRFWQEYWILASNLVPELEMTKPESKPSGAGFIWFRPNSLPRDVAIVHKLAYGNLDLQFAGRGAELFDFRKNPEKHPSWNECSSSKQICIRASQGSCIGHDKLF